MSIQGKKIACEKLSVELKEGIAKIYSHHHTALVRELALFHFRHAAYLRMKNLSFTPAERFNDDGTLKPAPELQHGEWHVKMGGLLYRLEKEYISREPKNFEASV